MSKSYDERIEAAQEWIEANGYMMNKENIGRLIAAFLDGDDLQTAVREMHVESMVAHAKALGIDPDKKLYQEVFVPCGCDFDECSYPNRMERRLVEVGKEYTE